MTATMRRCQLALLVVRRRLLTLHVHAVQLHRVIAPSLLSSMTTHSHLTRLRSLTSTTPSSLTSSTETASSGLHCLSVVNLFFGLVLWFELSAILPESFGKFRNLSVRKRCKISGKFPKNKYLLFLNVPYLTICALLFRINKQVRHYSDC